MKYVHEYEPVEGRDFFICRHCERECSDVNDTAQRADPCPDRIVQEVASRVKADLRAELQNANIVPAKRRDRQRP